MYEIVKSNVAIGVVDDAKEYRIKRNIDAMEAKSKELLSKKRKDIIGYSLGRNDEKRLLEEVKKEFERWLEENS